MPDEDWESELADQGKGLPALHGDPYWRVWILKGPGHQVHVLKVVMLPLIRERSVGPGLLDDLQGLQKKRPALTVVDVVALVGLQKELRPTPNNNRPWLMWSTIAASSATRSGLAKGKTCTARPIPMRLVMAAAALAPISGEANTALFGRKWLSPNQKVSSPASSARVTRSNHSLNVSAWLEPSRVVNMENMPMFMVQSFWNCRGEAQFCPDATVPGSAGFLTRKT